MFERLFPEVSSASASIGDYDQWLDQLSSHIEQTRRNTVKNNSDNHINSSPSHDKSTATVNNHVNHKANNTQANDSPVHGDDLLLENAKLQVTVAEYKSIVADTVRTG